MCTHLTQFRYCDMVEDGIATSHGQGHLLVDLYLGRDSRPSPELVPVASHSRGSGSVRPASSSRTRCNIASALEQRSSTCSLICREGALSRALSTDANGSQTREESLIKRTDRSGCVRLRKHRRKSSYRNQRLSSASDEKPQRNTTSHFSQHGLDGREGRIEPLSEAKNDPGVQELRVF
ncbi:hypothetical protein SISSUDRAFT_68776 [Sistotremastrum suecicum HHB10207 ss-3]|uniref:Uncharacterized protein n=1 Tax=Sistotremastrum suecicum HHB10207 ss-3 TaxID=1314776 RepID=A0A166BI66_9AGAM|nr:hypothetical protein SISSUDRAFT_68776 [Sistotremastrum suecicum HHB10207 ss-3]